MVGLFPGIPGIDSLGFATHKSPIIGAHALFHEQRKNCGKCTAQRPRHIFRADDWPLEAPQRFDTLLHHLGRVITMKRDDVRILKLKTRHRADLRVGPVSLPNPAGKRLRGLCPPSPPPFQLEQAQCSFTPVAGLLSLVLSTVVVRLIHQVPNHDPRVVPEVRDHPDHVGF